MALVKPKVIILFLRFGPSKTEHCIEILKRLEVYDPSRFICIENDFHFSEEPGPGIFLKGNNQSREFSGWNVGLEWIAANMPLENHDRLIFVNDTICKPETSVYLKRFHRSSFMKLTEYPIILGHIDAYPRKVSFLGHPLKRWVRSNCLSMNYGTAKRLTPFGLPMGKAEIFGSTPKELFLQSAPLSEGYQDYLREWMTGNRGRHPLGVSWYASAPIGEGNFQSVADKIHSILCEHYLSVKAESLGIGLIDFKFPLPFFKSVLQSLI